ncbi:hypothetical protein AN220_05880 [Streptomyces nanshensis]|nr:hypothetical protein AN220_05880 [Streptomyces nanshensis]
MPAEPVEVAGDLDQTGPRRFAAHPAAHPAGQLLHEQGRRIGRQLPGVVLGLVQSGRGDEPHSGAPGEVGQRTGVTAHPVGRPLHEAAATVFGEGPQLPLRGVHVGQFLPRQPRTAQEEVVVGVADPQLGSGEIAFDGADRRTGPGRAARGVRGGSGPGVLAGHARASGSAVCASRSRSRPSTASWNGPGCPAERAST